MDTLTATEPVETAVVPAEGPRRPRGLAAKIGEIKKHMTDSAVGPLWAAEKLCEVEADWPLYQAEAGGQSCADWCETALGSKGALAAARRRVAAVKVLASLGYTREFVLARTHHAVAVWLAGAAVPEALRRKAAAEVYAETKARGSLPLDLPRARAAAVCLQKGARPRAARAAVFLNHIERLEAIIASAGLEVPARPAGF